MSATCAVPHSTSWATWNATCRATRGTARTSAGSVAPPSSSWTSWSDTCVCTPVSSRTARTTPACARSVALDSPCHATSKITWGFTDRSVSRSKQKCADWSVSRTRQKWSDWSVSRTRQKLSYWSVSRNNNNALFYVLYLKIGAHCSLQSKEPRQSEQTSTQMCAHRHTCTIHTQHTHTNTHTHTCTHTQSHNAHTCMHTQHSHTQSVG